MSDRSLTSLHDDLWNELQATFLHCLSYMGDPCRGEGKKPGVTLGWKGTDRLVDARDGLQYRNHALCWHLSLLSSYKKHFESEIEKAILESVKEMEVRRNAQQKLGFILDDIVFNAMSVFDYTAEFIFATHIPDYRGNKTWSRLCKNTVKIEDQKLASFINDEHARFVKHLERYRGHVIHNKPEMGGIGFTHQILTNEVKHDMSLPEKLIQQLPIFAGDEPDIQIDVGAERIAKKTLEIEFEIVKQLAKFEFKPRRRSILEDTK